MNSEQVNANLWHRTGGMEKAKLHDLDKPKLWSPAKMSSAGGMEKARLHHLDEPKSGSPAMMRSADQERDRTAVLLRSDSKSPELRHKIEHSPIANASQECVRLFSSIISLQPKDRGQSQPNRLIGLYTGTVFPGVSEAFDRYKIWFANMGTYKNGYSTMDQRLKDTSNVSAQVILLLGDLNESLHDVFNIIRYDEGLWAEETDEDKLIEPDQQTSYDLEAEFEKILADIKHVISCLYRLSSIIKDPAFHDHIMSNFTVDTDDKSTEIQRVKKKHANISEELVGRLVSANSQRRVYFRYRKSRYDDVQTSSVTHLSEPHMHTDVKSGRKSSFRSTFETLSSRVPDLELEYQRAHESLGSAPGVTTAPLPSARSSSNDQLKTDISNAALLLAGRMKEESENEYTDSRIVLAPVDDEDTSGIFKGLVNLENTDLGRSSSARCPFCWAIVYNMTETEDWRDHIFSDLRPYICVETECSESDKLFESHQEWIQHVRHSHWMQWVCTAGCSTFFNEEVDLTNHLQAQHSDLASGHLEALVALSQRPGLGFHDIECPFCAETLTTEVRYQRHIGEHQILLALLALPLEESNIDEMDHPRKPSIVDADTNYSRDFSSRRYHFPSEERSRRRGGDEGGSRSGRRTALPSTYKLKWICPNCPGSNNAWDYDHSCPLCHAPRPANVATFYN